MLIKQNECIGSNRVEESELYKPKRKAKITILFLVKCIRLALLSATPLGDAGIHGGCASSASLSDPRWAVSFKSMTIGGRFAIWTGPMELAGAQLCRRTCVQILDHRLQR